MENNVFKVETKQEMIDRMNNDISELKKRKENLKHILMEIRRIDHDIKEKQRRIRTLNRESRKKISDVQTENVQ